ncbi:MAG: ribonuclease H-like domain-containing protein [Candidatus Magasanikbacteria bacterium]
MNTIVFDIETIPIDFNELDEKQQEYLLKFAENKEEEEQVRQQMALWAPTNKIVAIGVLSVETQKGAVYFQDGGTDIESYEKNGITYRSGDESDVLERFWEVMKTASQFVTFNGRSFDCPVLLLRSGMLGVRPSKNLVPYRYSTDVHVDLLEQLTFYGASRKFNLDMYCKSFGIKSPKTDVCGHDVKPLFGQGKYTDIAEYCAGDLFATRELFLCWKKYMAF